MYVTMDTIIRGLVDMVAGLVPVAFLIYTGYENNGGCSCGCTTECSRPYERWHCPGDIGYACSDALSNANVPFYGDPSRVPPCTRENHATKTVIMLFTYWVPSIIHMCLVVLCLRFPITNELTQKVADALAKREAGEGVEDPLTGQYIDPVRLDAKSQDMLDAVKHYTRNELESLVAQGRAGGRAETQVDNMMRQMRTRLVVRMLMLTTIVVVLWRDYIPAGPFHSALQSLAVLAIALLVMTITLNLMRQGNMANQKSHISYFVNYVIFDREYRGSKGGANGESGGAAAEGGDSEQGLNPTIKRASPHAVRPGFLTDASSPNLDVRPGVFADLGRPEKNSPLPLRSGVPGTRATLDKEPRAVLDKQQPSLEKKRVCIPSSPSGSAGGASAGKPPEAAAHAPAPAAAASTPMVDVSSWAKRRGQGKPVREFSVTDRVPGSRSPSPWAADTASSSRPPQKHPSML